MPLNKNLYEQSERTSIENSISASIDVTSTSTSFPAGAAADMCDCEELWPIAKFVLAVKTAAVTTG